MPDLAFNLFSLITAHKLGIRFMGEEHFSHVMEAAQQVGLLKYHTATI